MEENLQNRGFQDRTRINLNEQWEIDYWTDALECSESELRSAVKEVGDSIETVTDYLHSNDE